MYIIISYIWQVPDNELTLVVDVPPPNVVLQGNVLGGLPSVCIVDAKANNNFLCK